MFNAQDYLKVRSNILKVDGVDGCQTTGDETGFYIYSKEIMSYRDFEHVLNSIEKGVTAILGHAPSRHNIVFCPEPDSEGIFVRWWVEFLNYGF